LAALDLGAGVEQPFGCFIVQNRQAMQSMGRSMDWTLEDNMVDGLFFHATLTGRRGGHIPQQERKRLTLVRRRLCGTQALRGRVIPGVIKMRTLHLLHQKYICLLYDVFNWITPGQSTTNCLQLFGIFMMI